MDGASLCLFPVALRPRFAPAWLPPHTPGCVLARLSFPTCPLRAGLLLLSLHCIQEQRNVLAALLFAALLNMKHLFVYAAPLFLVYLLRTHCGGSGSGRRALRRFLGLGAAVGGVTALSFGPFVAMGQMGQVRAVGSVDASRFHRVLSSKVCVWQAANNAWARICPLPIPMVDPLLSASHERGSLLLCMPAAPACGSKPACPLHACIHRPVLGSHPPMHDPRMHACMQIMSRLFPFGRGLCHSYWAANAWALYSFADKLLAALLPRFGVHVDKPLANMAGAAWGWVACMQCPLSQAAAGRCTHCC